MIMIIKEEERQRGRDSESMRESEMHTPLGTFTSFLLEEDDIIFSVFGILASAHTHSNTT